MIRLAVWRLDRQAANPWTCERCQGGVEAHAIDAGDPDAEVDELGVYVPGYRLAPTARGDLEDARFHRCPERDLHTWCADLLQLWRLSDGELSRAVSLFGCPPSAAFVDAWDVLTVEVAALRRVLDKRRGDS